MNIFTGPVGRVQSMWLLLAVVTVLFGFGLTFVDASEHPLPSPEKIFPASTDINNPTLLDSQREVRLEWESVDMGGWYVRTYNYWVWEWDGTDWIFIVGSEKEGEKDNAWSSTETRVHIVNDLKRETLYRWNVTTSFGPNFWTTYHSEPKPDAYFKTAGVAPPSTTPPSEPTSSSSGSRDTPSTTTPSSTMVVPPFDNPIDSDNLGELIQLIMRFLIFMAIAIAPLLYIAAGFILITAGGSPDSIKKAKDIFVWTTVGFVIILLAAGFESFIRSVIGV